MKMLRCFHGLMAILMTGVCAASAVGQDAATVEPMPGDQPVLMLKLTDGSLISGRLTVHEIIVDTSFGRLTVPMEKIISFRPGLESRPKFSKKILGMIDKLGSDKALERDAAQRDLMAMGPSVRGLLVPHLEDADPERKLRVQAIIDQLDELIQDDELVDAKTFEPIRKRDTIVTTEFTIIGTISPKTFTVNNRYGKLVVNLADIDLVSRKAEKQPKVVRKELAVEGANVVPRQFKNSRIRLRRGQRVAIKAGGTVTLSPWGEHAVCTPDGSSAYGWHVQNQIPNGALVARIGDGPVFLVGSKLKFTAKQAGQLQFGVATLRNQASQSFPGQFELKITVVDPK